MSQPMFDEQTIRVLLCMVAIVVYESVAMYFYTVWQSKSDRSLLNGLLGFAYTSVILLLFPMYISGKLPANGFCQNGSWDFTPIESFLVYICAILPNGIPLFKAYKAIDEPDQSGSSCGGLTGYSCEFAQF